jgi:hypothetical protein
MMKRYVCRYSFLNDYVHTKCISMNNINYKLYTQQHATVIQSAPTGRTATRILVRTQKISYFLFTVRSSQRHRITLSSLAMRPTRPLLLSQALLARLLIHATAMLSQVRPPSSFSHCSPHLRKSIRFESVLGPNPLLAWLEANSYAVLVDPPLGS